jgi:hypothetical protein
VGTRKDRAELEIVDPLLQRLDRSLDLLEGFLVVRLPGELQQRSLIFDLTLERRVKRQCLLQLPELPEKPLGSIRFFPKVGALGDLL